MSRRVGLAGARPGRPQDTDQLARDVVTSGASLEQPLGLLPFFSRTLTPEKAARCLDEGKELRVWLADADVALPLKDAEDLREVAVFQQLRPAESLVRPERARALLNLAEQGWNFHDGNGNRVGAFGAYNELEESAPVQALRGGRRHALGNDAELLELSTAAPVTLESARVSLEGVNGPERKRLARYLTRELSRSLTPEQLVEAAMRLAPEPFDPVRVACLERLAALPSTRAAGRWALEASRCLPDWLQTSLWTSLSGSVSHGLPEVASTVVKAGGERLGKEVTEQLFHSLVQSLALDPDCATAATALQAWQPADPGRAMGALLSAARARTPGELQNLAEQALVFDRSAQRRHLEEVGRQADHSAAERVLKLHQATDDYYVTNSLWMAAMHSPSAATGVEAARVAAAIYARLGSGSSPSEEAQKSLGEGLLRWLSEFPDTAPATATLRALAPENIDRAARALVTALASGLPVDRENIATATLVNDRSAQRGHLRAIAQDPANNFAARALKLHEATTDYYVTNALWKAAVEHPAGRTGAEVAAFAASVYGHLSGSASEEALTDLGCSLVDWLNEFPDTAPATSWLRTLQVLNADRAARALVASLSTGGDRDQLAAQALVFDREAQRRFLRRLASNPANNLAARALELHQATSDYYVTNSLWKAAMAKPAGSTGHEVAGFAAEVYRQLESGGGSASEEALKDLGSGLIGWLAECPDTAGAATALRELAPANPNLAARALVNGLGSGAVPSQDRLASEALVYDRAAQRRHLKILAANPANNLAAHALRLHEATEDYYVTNSLWKAAVARPSGRGGADLVAFAADLYGHLGASASEEALKELGLAVMTWLAEAPDTAGAASPLRDLQPGNPNLAARALVKHLKSGKNDPDLLASDALIYDREAQRRHLRRLARDPANNFALRALKLHEAQADYYVTNSLWRAALEHPSGKTGGQVADFALSTYRHLNGNSSASEEALNMLGSSVMTWLTEFPETASTAATVIGWGPTSTDRAARALVESPLARTPEELGQVARKALRYCPAAQLSYLEQVKDQRRRRLAELAARVFPELKSYESQQKLFDLVLDARPGMDLAEALKSLAGSLSAHDARQFEYLLREAVAEQEVRRLVQGSRQASAGFEEQEGRLLVGGVVVKKARDDGHPSINAHGAALVPSHLQR